MGKVQGRFGDEREWAEGSRQGTETSRSKPWNSPECGHILTGALIREVLNHAPSIGNGTRLGHQAQGGSADGATTKKFSFGHSERTRHVAKGDLKLNFGLNNSSLATSRIVIFGNVRRQNVGVFHRCSEENKSKLNDRV